MSFYLLGNDWRSSNVSFLFSLRNNENIAPFIANVTRDHKGLAIFCGPSFGPSFGGGHDIHIANNANYNQLSYSNFGCYYQSPPGVRDVHTLLAGSYKFTPTEIEGRKIKGIKRTRADRSKVNSVTEKMCITHDSWNVALFL